jgi:hypothetical protein
MERKSNFDTATYTEKRQLATEIVQIIHGLKPPGRFLKKASEPKKISQKKADETHDDGDKPTAAEGSPELIDGIWEQLSDDKSIHKACQVMRDINRPDRKHREERKEERKKRKLEKLSGAADESDKEGDVKMEEGDGKSKDEEMKELAEKAAVEVVDKALAAAPPAETAEV